MPARSSTLWRHVDFFKLWASDTFSLLGVYTTFLALPLTAVAVGATASQLGLLAALQTLPSLLFGLIAGVWIDRLRRRPVLIVANLARAALLGVVPVAAVLERITLPLLYAVAFLTGLGTVFFVIAYQSYLPTVVPRERLVEGNSKLRMSESVAQVAGPGFGGVLVQLLTAPLALLVSATAALFSALTLLAIRTPEPAPLTATTHPHIRREIVEGVRFVAQHPVLRTLSISTIFAAFGRSMIAGIVVLYATRDLGLSAAQLGLAFAVGGAPAVLGALLAERVLRRYGAWATLSVALAASGIAATFLPLASGPRVVVLGFIIAWQVLEGLAAALSGIVSFALVQAAPPPELLGRVNATIRVCVGAAMALGALLGGGCGQLIGLRPTIVLAAMLILFAPFCLARLATRPLRARMDASVAVKPPASAR